MSKQTCKPRFVYLIDNDDATVRQVTSLLLDETMAGRRFHSLVEFLHWLDYDRVEERSVIAAAIDLPDISGFDLLNILQADRVTIPTVLMGQMLSVARAVDAMRAGASFILNKPFSNQEFVSAIEKAVRTEKGRVPKAADSQPVRQRYSSLSKRQRQMLRYVFDGQTNREIADRLAISAKTVEVHRSAMMNKMGAGSLVELVRIVASCEDLLSKEPRRV